MSSSGLQLVPGEVMPVKARLPVVERLFLPLTLLAVIVYAGILLYTDSLPRP